ncbi:related to mitochondrial large ribosomal subunit [Lecanosticta acicola]|uniref:Related to mitochondrial large ribosomal subunit n=1 Tax=Lecanosticta acicola TaxID=111012 RepID=A0AAI8YP35_9PEZI|nr:related to mitochondrial large ribosomal subunit [Lecanosticta acicola]
MYGRKADQTTPGLSRNPPLRLPVPHQQRRLASEDRSSDGNQRSNPVLEEYKRKHPDKPAKQEIPEGVGQPGDIAASSIFEDERRASSQQDGTTGTEEEEVTRVGGIVRDPANIARVLMPKPHARERYERKKVIQMVRKGARLTPKQFVKRTEREHLNKSYEMKTSVKKLGMLARQIAGKPIDEAIVQMRFSKKKVAQEILKQLEFARDEAVVMRGMGLGNAAAAEDKDKDILNDTSSDVTGLADGDLEEAKGRQRKTAAPIDIQLKDGKRHRVTDLSKIYIDQAWVGRGKYGKLPDYRARGRVNIMRTPWTSISVVLKEEATRVREYQEREAKRQKQLREKVWRALPDRPIQIQRQWYSW